MRSLHFLYQLPAFRKPLGKKAVTVDLYKLELNKSIGHSNGSFLRQRFTQGSFPSTLKH